MHNKSSLQCTKCLFMTTSMHAQTTYGGQEVVIDNVLVTRQLHPGIIIAESVPRHALVTQPSFSYWSRDALLSRVPSSLISYLPRVGSVNSKRPSKLRDTHNHMRTRISPQSSGGIMGFTHNIPQHSRNMPAIS